MKVICISVNDPTNDPTVSNHCYGFITIGKWYDVLGEGITISLTLDWKHYEMKARPSLWYNGYDGIKVGAHLNGGYMNTKHVFDVTAWFSTGFGQAYLDSTTNKNKYNTFSFLLNYKTSTAKFIKKSNIS